MMIREITVYSNGDSRDLATWSNVPYLFCKSLEKRGIKVNRIDISANRKLERFYNTLFFRLFRTLFRRNSSPTFYRSPFHRWIVNRRLKKAAKQYPHSDIHLFLSYLFINKYSDKPSVLWCDWTDRVVIERMGREPAWHERWSLAQEDKVIYGAALRYTMFPVCKTHMENLYGCEFRYLNRNVVNTMFEEKVDLSALTEKRINSKRILFIGNYRYKSAAIELIEAFAKLQEQQSNIHLDIIGMTYKDLPDAMNIPNVKCHGYLRKNEKAECERYYDLLFAAKVFVNPASQWGGFSSTVEAMYYGCPVIVSAYDDFKATFGDEIDFGSYRSDKAELSKQIDDIINADDQCYRKMAESAYMSVKDFTWDSYIDSFLKDIKKELISR